MEQTPVLILPDGMLPDQDGLDLLRLLEKQKSTQGIRKIMLSARPQRATRSGRSSWALMITSPSHSVHGSLSRG